MSIAPGWYKDPAEPTTQRWWDGEGWVGDPLPAEATPPPGPPPEAPPDQPSGAGGAEPAGAGSGAASGAGAPVDSRDGGSGTDGIGAGQSGPDARGGIGTDQREPAHRTSGGAASPDRTAAGAPHPHGYPLATLGQRLVARLVDIGLVFALNLLVNSWFVYEYVIEVAPVVEVAQRQLLAGEGFGGIPDTSDRADTLLIVILTIAAALWFAYEIPAVANNGQTPGKRLLRIKVVRLEESPARAEGGAGPEEPLGFGRSFRRWNTMGLPVLLWWCFGIGFLLQLVDALFALFDRPLQQALHDKSAHTAVVAIPSKSGKEAPDAPADPS